METRNRFEGVLRWVQASGSGKAWQTASAPASGTFGFVTNFTFTTALDRQVISERGIPSHHKLVALQSIPISCDVLFADTANVPKPATASGSTTPMVHLELRMSAPELGATSAIYAQFYGVAFNSQDFTETNPANTQRLQGVALAMSAWNASGYLG